ncbi:MAG: phosphate acyltransferase PlsX, partial [Opitutales bacterium]
SEALFKTLRSIINDEVRRKPLRMIGGLLLKGAFKDVKHRLDPDRYCGAPLLGLQGNVIKAHGSASAVAMASAIRIAGEFIEYDMTRHACEDIARANAILSAPRVENVAETV